MLYFNITNYADFCEKFGKRETTDGQTVRVEKIALQILKDMFRNKTNDPDRWDDFFGSKTIAQPMKQSDFSGMFCLPTFGMEWKNVIMDGAAALPSDTYEVLNGGICFDGDTGAIRYRKEGRIYKMKASKLFAKIFSENKLDKFYGERMKVYLAERFSERWQSYASTKCGSEYELHVDDDFKAIYSVDNMVSCMAGRGNWRFYRDAVNAKAAYLTNMDGDIVARCVVFMEAHQKGTGKVMRYAERQYAINQDDRLKAILIGKLYDGGYIDCHKRVGAGCYSTQDIQGPDYKNIDTPYFSIVCDLHDGDTLSFQDTFTGYDEDGETAYNYGSHTYDLATTDGTFDSDEGKVYSRYHGEYIDEDDAVWVDTREDYFYSDETHYCENIREDAFEDDCVMLGNGDYAYFGYEGRGYDDVRYCDECKEYYLEEDAVYSELTEKYYCCEECKDGAEERYKKNHWHLCDYDGEYYENEDDLLCVMKWYGGLCQRYEEYTITKEDFNRLAEYGEATEYNGEYFLDEVGSDGEPAHIACYVA